jgi:hypothetical protein
MAGQPMLRPELLAPCLLLSRRKTQRHPRLPQPVGILAELAEVRGQA